MTCNPDFFGTWSVAYLDEPVFSGTMVVSNQNGRIIVTGSILKNGRPDGSYLSADAQCPNDNDRQMSLSYTLASGDTGRLTLSLAQIDFGQPIVNGIYTDSAPGGDSGRIRLQRM
jgi:hypothetical protein